MVIQQAMAAGMPVIATAVGGVPGLVDDGVTGFVVPPGDGQAAGAALARLMSDEGLRRRMGEAARAKAEQHFRPARVADQMVTMYRDIRGT